MDYETIWNSLTKFDKQTLLEISNLSMAYLYFQWSDIPQRNRDKLCLIGWEFAITIPRVNA